MAFVLMNAESALADGVSNSCSSGVTITVQRVSGPTLLLGEPLDLVLLLKNNAGKDVAFHKPSAEIGSVRLYRSDDSSPLSFAKIWGPGWGLEDTIQSAGTLPANGSYSLGVRVLYQIGGQPYAFGTPGVFHVKLTYQDGLACPDRVETPVVDAQVVAPTGNDLTVWNAIRSCSRCAYLLHTGEIGPHNQEGQDAVALLRSLVKQYPGSRYARLIRRQLKELDEKDHGPEGRDRDREGRDKERGK